MRDAAGHEGAGARPADRDLLADLEGDFAAQDVGHLIAVAVKVECRIGAGRRGFLEQHDAVAGLAAQQLERGRAAGRHAQYRAATRRHDNAPRIHLHILPCSRRSSWLLDQDP
jgi:hypothetical protein